MRKLISISVMFFLFLSMNTIAFANDSDPSVIFESEPQTVSEFELFKEVKRQSKDILLKQGFSEEKIDYIKAFDFHKYAEEMRSCSDKELMERGLTSEEIWKVRNSSSDAVVLAETMGNVTYRIAVIYYTYDSAKKITSLSTNATWEWSKRPVQTFNDIIGVGTSAGFKKDSGSTTVNYYKNGNTSSTKITSSFSLKTQNSGLNAFSSFPMLKVIYPGKDPADKYYAMSGSCRTEWSVSGNIRTVGVSCNYGHAILSCTPGISVSKGGIGISFTPSASIKQGTEAYISVNRK